MTPNFKPHADRIRAAVNTPGALVCGSWDTCIGRVAFDVGSIDEMIEKGLTPWVAHLTPWMHDNTSAEYKAREFPLGYADALELWPRLTERQQRVVLADVMRKCLAIAAKYAGDALPFVQAVDALWARVQQGDEPAGQEWAEAWAAASAARVPWAARAAEAAALAAARAERAAAEAAEAAGAALAGLAAARAADVAEATADSIARTFIESVKREAA